jgi:serine/threonine-protein kinase
MINVFTFLSHLVADHLLKRVSWDELLTTSTLLRGRYYISKVHEQGRDNPVYLACDKYQGKNVAVKQNTFHDVPHVRQFQLECTILANLDHPNIPKAFDYFLEEGRQFFVMDYIEGINLQKLLLQRTLSMDEILDWAGQLCDILAYLHSRIPAVIHRDVEPSNIILTNDGKIFLVDFGFAKLYDPQGENNAVVNFPIRRPSNVESTEISDPQKARLVIPMVTDRRSDEYSLAATLYALLTGKPPADSRKRLLGKAKLDSIRALRPDLSPFAEDAIFRALSLDPNKRYSGIEDFSSALGL